VRSSRSRTRNSCAPTTNTRPGRVQASADTSPGHACD
jgi:hypothetical protein